MSDLNESGVASRDTDHRKTVVLLLIVAAGLFFASALVQWNASMQRWVTFSGSTDSNGPSAEDHMYDYYLPSEEWVPIGSAAELLGIGLLLMAMGFAVFATAVLLIPDPTKDHIKAVAAMSLGFDLLLVLATAGSFAWMGLHTLLSGLQGAEAGLLDSGLVRQLLLYLGFLAPVILAVRWRNRLPAASITCVFLLGSTIVGYMVSTYLLAPLIAGMSHDTARWTETVIAVSTAAAGVATVYGIFQVRRLKALSPESQATYVPPHM